MRIQTIHTYDGKQKHSTLHKYIYTNSIYNSNCQQTSSNIVSQFQTGKKIDSTKVTNCRSNFKISGEGVQFIPHLYSYETCLLLKHLPPEFHESVFVELSVSLMMH